MEDRLAKLEITTQLMTDLLQGQAGQIEALTQACRALLATHQAPHLAAAYLNMGLAQAEADAVSSALSERRVEALQDCSRLLLNALVVCMEAAAEERRTPPPP